MDFALADFDLILAFFFLFFAWQFTYCVRELVDGISTVHISFSFVGLFSLLSGIFSFQEKGRNVAVRYGLYPSSSAFQRSDLLTR